MGLTQKLGTIPLAILTDASNNVGIGGSPSGSYKLEVTGTAKVSSTLLVSGAATLSSTLDVSTNATFNATTLRLGNDSNSGYNSIAFQGNSADGYNKIFAGSSTNDGVYIAAKTGQGIRFWVNGSTQAFYINSSSNTLFSGKVGIGTTTTPSYLLDLQTTAVSEVDTYSGIQLQSSNYGYVIEGGLKQLVGGELLFKVNNGGSISTKMTLNTYGNLILSRTTYSSIQAVGCYDDTTAGGSTLTVNSAGNFCRTPSSLRYKKDVETLDSSISESIYKMRPIWYRSISNHDRDDWSWYGLAAEEIAEIEPRLVQWGYKREDYFINEETGEQELKEGAELQADGVYYDKLTVLLVAEMQKQNKIIEDLKSRLDKAGL